MPFDEARARRAFDLIDRLITGDSSLTPATLGLFEASELVEVALFLDHGKLLWRWALGARHVARFTGCAGEYAHCLHFNLACLH